MGNTTPLRYKMEMLRSFYSVHFYVDFDTIFLARTENQKRPCVYIPGDYTGLYEVALGSTCV